MRGFFDTLNCNGRHIYLNYSRHSLTKNFVGRCLIDYFFNQWQSKVCVLKCIFVIFAMQIASFGSDSWFKLRLVYYAPADKEGEL